jgi:hypothetical protein
VNRSSESARRPSAQRDMPDTNKGKDRERERDIAFGADLFLRTVEIWTVGSSRMDQYTAADGSYVETTSLAAAKSLKAHYGEQLRKERAAEGTEQRENLDDFVETELVITTREDNGGRTIYRIRY